jgi:hypothetical protein
MHFDNAAVVGTIPNLEGLRVLDDRFAKLRANNHDVALKAN